MSSAPIAPVASAAVRRQLHWVAIVALLDFVLLVPLAGGALTGHHQLARSLGPIHGVGFIVELLLAVRGVTSRFWGWWFPAVVLVTGGPLGALIGHRVVSARLSAAEAPRSREVA
ncbi:MAG: hypothetical protein QOG45_1632 [Chloroflexota bacterium]|jgi:hypothetical protein|nr:hypothetical protein [Chloroflexota bacterium]